mmetsp:Transcript_26605/g.67584  ORF Transcript_26605/g.67584 Transcript_26605/m.67584 type:complete len:138 (-) Transcript_26605:662-1075(-)
MHLFFRHSRILEHVVDRHKCSLKEVNAQLLQLGTCDLDAQIPPALDVFDLNRRLQLCRQRSFCVLTLPPQPGDGALVLFGELLACSRLKLLRSIRHDALVEVFTPKMCVAVGRQYLEYSIVDSQQGHVECAPPQIKH